MSATFVIDVSFVMASVLPDEDGADVDPIMDRVISDGAVTADLFWHELRNALIVAERRKRLAAGSAETELAAIRALPIDTAPSSADAHVLALARAHGLTAYDAAYLHLALSRGLPLATMDEALAKAAKAAGVAQFARKQDDGAKG